jgi:hypothetical protein
MTFAAQNMSIGANFDSSLFPMKKTHPLFLTDYKSVELT